MSQLTTRPTSERLPSGTYLAWTFTLLSVLLGGASSAGFLGNLVLQVSAVVVLAWLCLRGGFGGRTNRSIASAAALFILIGIVELVPLPQALWSHLPFRELVSENLALAGARPGWMPLSLTPHATLASLLSLLPAAAMGAFVLDDRRGGAFLPAAVVAAAVTSVFLGIGQAAGGRDSALYLYEVTNEGWSVGFFANKNHLATLTLSSLPCLAALYAGEGGHGAPAPSLGRTIAISTIGIFLVAGTLITGSNAGLLLVLPVIIASLMILGNLRLRIRIFLLTVGLATSALICAYLFWPSGAAMIRQATGEVQDRQEIWAQGWKILLESFPSGTGLGSFSAIYALFDNSSDVTEFFINHAHNDYLELTVELGVVGVILVLCFLYWWSTTALKIWKSDARLPKAATLVSAIVLVHSSVDYPVRTAAIMVIFASALAIMGRAGWEAAMTRPTWEKAS